MARLPSQIPMAASPPAPLIATALATVVNPTEGKPVKPQRNPRDLDPDPKDPKDPKDQVKAVR